MIDANNEIGLFYTLSEKNDNSKIDGQTAPEKSMKMDLKA